MRGTLLIGCLPRIIIPVARRLAARGIPVHAAYLGGGRQLRSRSLLSCTFLRESESEPEQFFEALSELIAAKDIDTIMPCGDECLRALAPHDEKIRALAYYCAPPAASALKIVHKPETLAIAEAAGIPVPRDYDVPDINTLDAMRDEIVFPIIVKPRVHQGEEVTGIKCETVRTFERLHEHFERFPDFGKWFLIQDFIPGHGVAVDVLMHNGVAVAATQHRRLREYPVRGGVSISAETEAIDPDLYRHSVNLLRALEWEGVAMVEFRKDPESGRVGLMEVNGRFWGSISLSLHSGVDFPWYLWQIAHGQQPTPATPRVGTRFRWLAGDLKRMWECMSSPERYGWRVASQAFGDCVGTKDSIWSCPIHFPQFMNSFFPQEPSVSRLRARWFAPPFLLWLLIGSTPFGRRA